MIRCYAYFGRVFLIFMTALALASCDKAPEETQSSTDNTSSNNTLAIDQVEKAPEGWPRSIMTSQGLLTLEQAPSRIVSTSVTLSGTLLAIDAPLIASGATMPNTSVASGQGFMRQWASIAEARGVIPLYQTEPNAEAIIKANPELIIISATGGDSAMKLYDQLKDIAPTLVIGYDNKSWMQLAQIFGDLLGLEGQAKSVIQDFEQKVADTKSRITLPPQPTTAMVYYRDDTGGNIWTTKSAQGRLLKELGFTLAEVPESVKGNISMGLRDDIIIATGERFPDAVNGNSVLLFSASQEREQALKNNNYLQSSSAIQNDQVFAVGNDTFRLDYYSASNLLTRLQNLFGRSENGQ
ncbi:Fe2+-enterobactin ABC transporter substrate-binding protein [Marinomonas sp. 2405UD66-6]|uniref:Fe2+-enterobactin ABC transporter substrate-binding protein n=1 Tax=Marinomonas sp. 2405UD66-6 TaxID=3391834 RepID=UPI0039C92A42